MSRLMVMLFNSPSAKNKTRNSNQAPFKAKYKAGLMIKFQNVSIVMMSLVRKSGQVTSRELVAKPHLLQLQPMLYIFKFRL